VLLARALTAAFVAVLAASGCSGEHSSTASAGPLPSSSSSPASGAVVASLTIRPSRHLKDGQLVTVTLRGFRPGEKVFLSECGPHQRPSRLSGCQEQAAAEQFTITDDSGARGGTRFRVSAMSHGHACRPSCSIAALGNHELVTARIFFG
jgi:hypothetical protein